MTIQFCRVCGVDLFPNGNFEALENYLPIYSQLTSIHLEEDKNLHDLKVCITCTEKLQDFDRFRNICLQVHWRLINVKSEQSKSCDDPESGLDIKCEPADIIDSHKSECSETSDDDGDNEEECEDDEDIKSFETPVTKCEEILNALDHPKLSKQRDDRNLKSLISLYQCDRCPKKFRVKLRLDAHKRTHDGLKPFECKVCGKGFAKSTNLKVHHIQKHTESRISIPCDFPGCGNAFATRQGLKRHWLRMHDPEYVAPETTVFICDTCGKKFTTNGALKKHQFIHTPNEMPFVCGTCGKKFPTSHKLKEHTMRHEGIKNHTCSFCGLRKTTMHELKTHINNIHTKGRTYPCNICASEFSNVGNLHRHVRIVHLGLKPYVCKVCDRAFGKSDHLKRHMKSHNSSVEIANDAEVPNVVDEDVEINFVVEKIEPVTEIAPSI